MDPTLDKESLRKALKRLDHVRVQQLLESCDWRERDLDEAIQQVIHTGCLIQLYGSDAQATKKSCLLQLISEHSTLEQLQRLALHVVQATLIQIAFAEIKT
jgi:hypothetical protein